MATKNYFVHNHLAKAFGLVLLTPLFLGSNCPGPDVPVIEHSMKIANSGMGTIKTSNNQVKCHTCFYSQMNGINLTMGGVNPCQGFDSSNQNCPVPANESSYTLTAVPDGGYIFLGWGGACSGTGTCVVSGSSPLTAEASFQSIYAGPAWRFQGKLVHSNGTAVTNRSASLKVTVLGKHLVNGGGSISPCSGYDNFMSLQYTRAITTDGSGRFDFTIPKTDMTASVDAGCPAANFLISEITSIKYQATFSPVTTGSDCANACTGLLPTNQGICTAECKSGRRDLIAKATILPLKISAGTDANGNITVDTDATTLEFTGASGSPSGPNLTVPGQKTLDGFIYTETVNSASFPCAVAEACFTGSGTRRILRFDTYIQNNGNLDFVLGDPSTNPTNPANGLPMFNFSSCHGHYHFSEAMDYKLLNVTKTSIVAQGHKQGFCMIDDTRFSGSEAAKFTCSNQGLTVGFEDVYHGNLDCQWIDVTGLPAGTYYIQMTSNPNGNFFETDYLDNASTVPVVIN